MLLVKSGQLSELTELFNRYQVKLYNFFLKMTLDKAVSEDLTQNLFYRILKYKHSFQDGNGSFKSWIYGMARNIHTDHYNQGKKMPDRFKQAEWADLRAPDEEITYRGAAYQGAADDAGADSARDDGAGANGDVAWPVNSPAYTEEHYEQLEMALARLQPEQREILVLSRYQGLKYEEISRIRGISVSTIKVQAHRAIKQLRTLYFNHSNEEGLS